MPKPRVALLLGSVALLLMPLAGLGHRAGIYHFAVALSLGMTLAPLLGAAAVIIGVRALRRGGRTPIALAGIVFGLVSVAIPVYWLQRGLRAPLIHDITTDVANPPTYDAIVPLRANDNPLDYDPEVGRQQQEAYPYIVPLTLSVPPAEAFTRALATAQDLGWDIVAANQQASRIEAIALTYWYGFKDDVVIRLTPEGAGTRVDVRSVSRVGANDLETNARRIRRYLTSLRERGLN